MDHVSSELKGDQVQQLMREIMSRPSKQPDLIMVDPYWYDTLKTTQEVLSKYENRNWRRLKREMRKAMLQVRRRDRERLAGPKQHLVRLSTSVNTSVNTWWRGGLS